MQLSPRPAAGSPLPRRRDRGWFRRAASSRDSAGACKRVRAAAVLRAAYGAVRVGGVADASAVAQGRSTAVPWGAGRLAKPQRAHAVGAFRPGSCAVGQPVTCGCYSPRCCRVRFGLGAGSGALGDSQPCLGEPAGCGSRRVGNGRSVGAGEPHGVPDPLAEGHPVIGGVLVGEAQQPLGEHDAHRGGAAFGAVAVERAVRHRLAALRPRRRAGRSRLHAWLSSGTTARPWRCCGLRR